MNEEEQRILITQARSGMILSRPVVLPNKISLCGTGTELTDELIQRFIVRGIKRIFVQGNPLPSQFGQPLPAQKEALHRRFSRVQNSGLMVSLMRAIEEEISSKWV